MVSTYDLTRGPIKAQLVALAVPLLAGNILQKLYNAVDAVVVGKIVGDTAFAAVGVAGSVMNLFLFLISGGCTGVSVLLAQLYGAGEEEDFRKDFFLASVFGAILSLALSGLAFLVIDPLLKILQTPDDIFVPTLDYLYVIFLGFLPAFAFHLSSGVLRAVGNTKAALSFLSVSMIVNMALDILFVAGLNMGVAGAAWATVTAQLLAAVCSLIYLKVKFPQMIFGRADMVYDGPLLRRTAHFGFVSSLHMCSLYIGKLLVQGTVNSLGTDAITAFTAAIRIEAFANSFGDSGCTAMSVFVGQNTGAGSKKRVKEGFRQGQWLLVALSIFMSLIMILGARPLLALVLPAGSEGCYPAAAGYLRLVAVFYFLNFIGSGQVGYFEGRGLVNLPVIGATGHITFRVIAFWLLADVMGLPGLALATGLGWLGAVSFWYLRWRRDQRDLE